MKTGLEMARDDALRVLDSFDPTDPEYTKTMNHVKTLSDLIAQESPEKLSPNTMAIVFGNIGIGIMVVGFEKANVVTTKVLAFLTKAK